LSTTVALTIDKMGIHGAAEEGIQYLGSLMKHAAYAKDHRQQAIALIKVCRTLWNEHAKSPEEGQYEMLTEYLFYLPNTIKC
jgi:hypothetical protein